MDKLGVIVPYRNREEHLEEFKKKISKYLNRQGIPFELIIVHQDDAKLFNRGALLNIGFTYAEKYECDYVVFHDVDMLARILLIVLLQHLAALLPFPSTLLRATK